MFLVRQPRPNPSSLLAAASPNTLPLNHKHLIPSWSCSKSPHLALNLRHLWFTEPNYEAPSPKPNPLSFSRCRSKPGRNSLLVYSEWVVVCCAHLSSICGSLNPTRIQSPSKASPAALACSLISHGRHQCWNQTDLLASKFHFIRPILQPVLGRPMLLGSRTWDLPVGPRREAQAIYHPGSHPHELTAWLIRSQRWTKLKNPAGLRPPAEVSPLPFGNRERERKKSPPKQRTPPGFLGFGNRAVASSGERRTPAPLID